MKTWVYRVIWKRGNKQVPDGRVFLKKESAETYAGIEMTQMENDGMKYNIETLELVMT